MFLNELTAEWRSKVGLRNFSEINFGRIMSKAQLSIGIDVGGTFTDFFFYDSSSGRVETEKLLTSTAEPEKSIVEGIRNGLNRLGARGEDIQSIIHGTTLIVNAIIERKEREQAF